MKQFSKGSILISKSVPGISQSRRVTAEVCGIDAGKYQLAIHSPVPAEATAAVSMAMDAVHRDFELQPATQPVQSIWMKLLLHGDGHGG